MLQYIGWANGLQSANNRDSKLEFFQFYRHNNDHLNLNLISFKSVPLSFAISRVTAFSGEIHYFNAKQYKFKSKTFSGWRPESGMYELSIISEKKPFLEIHTYKTHTTTVKIRIRFSPNDEN